jgi:DNA gyrase/topoisomerase IV subunit B
MRKKAKAEVKASKGVTGWTRITFTPDWERFGMRGFDDDILALFKKRVYDMAGACTPKGLKVYYNQEKLEIKDFKNYCQLFLGNGAHLAYAANDRYDMHHINGDFQRFLLKLNNFQQNCIDQSLINELYNLLQSIKNPIC